MTNDKKVLGLDLGTNSIGWAIVDAVQTEDNLKPVAINKAGCRIIPMEASIMGDFEAGNSVSQTKDNKFLFSIICFCNNITCASRNARNKSVIGLLQS